MSSPSPDFDQLLSDRLDGRLDENDARMLDAKLRDDAALRSQYDAMLADRERMKALFASSVQSQPRLSADFASRVLAEGRRRGLAVSRDNETLANSENASVARPVQRSSTQSASHRSRWIVGVAASAAAVLVSWSLSGRTDVGNVSTIAQNTDPANALSVDTQAIPSTLADSKITEPAIAPVDVTDASPSLMASDVTSESDVDAETPSMNVDLMDVAPKPAAASIASAAAPASMDMSSSVSIGSNDSPALDAPSLAGALMVYDVRLNQKGRVSGVFAQAMQRNGLDETSRAAVNRDVIAAAKRADVFDQDESFQIVFLQAS
ncbi:MAG: anti-sigma factor family protein, partial [Rhodopirellula sp. JB044]|uniref:anti-sigma factor family protein n=1 Tax=Rhodopirellula sp. JB044 TaxID=3342844 RepID=UPI00370CE180